MELNPALSAIEAQIGQGELEPAIDALVKLLEQQPDLIELAKDVRVNQADFFATKAQSIRGTIANDDLRLANNQITERLLYIIQRVKAGKTSLEDPRPVVVATDSTAQTVALPVEAVVTVGENGSKVWRYYLAGGVVALALALVAWKFLGRNADACPEYGKDKTMRIMILPFKRTGEQQNAKREFDISDGLNDLIQSNSILNVVAECDVNEQYDIEADYPTPSRAAEIAKNCGVDMVIWGKVRNSGDSVEVRYKLVNPAQAVSSSNAHAGADSIFNSLMLLKSDGVWMNNYKTITKLLYIVVANNAKQSAVAAKMVEDVLLAQAAPATSKTTDVSISVDTTTLLSIAETYLVNKQYDKALEQFDQILTAYPQNQTARRLRGMYYFDQKDYAMAADDLEVIGGEPEKTDTKVLQARAEANMRSSRVRIARRDIAELERRKTKEPEVNSWLQKRSLVLQDSTAAVNTRLQNDLAAARKKPADLNLKTRVAADYLHIGRQDEAINVASSVLNKDPRHPGAVEVKVRASVQKGDTLQALETIEKAMRAGAQAKDIRFKPSVAPLRQQ
jgi:tetratricopeptide (TPR) repeat protein/TolB-like protein